MQDEENKEERHTKGKNILCDVTAHNLKNTIMKYVKDAEKDIASACAIFHKRYEQRTGKPIKTVSEFEQVTIAFSKLPKSEMDKLIEEGKEEDRKRREATKEMMKRRK